MLALAFFAVYFTLFLLNTLRDVLYNRADTCDPAPGTEE